MNHLKRAVIVGSFLALVALTRPAAAQTAEQFTATRDLVVSGLATNAYQCPGLPRVIFAILQHAEAVGPGERRCAALEAALHCITHVGRTGLLTRPNGTAPPTDPTFARFRQDGASLGFAAALAAAIQGLLTAAGC